MSFQPQPPGICFQSSLLTHRKCLSNLTYPKYTSAHLHPLPPNHNKFLLIPTHLKYTIYSSIRNIHSLPSTNQTRPNTDTLPKNTPTDHHLFIKVHPTPPAQHIPLLTHENVHPQNYLSQLILCIPIVKDSIFCH